MDLLLLLILIPLVALIGYILSRPFENPQEYIASLPQKAALDDQYHALLHEIKALQNELETRDNPGKLKNQIEAKKQQAADLLRQIKPDLES